ncbi:transposase IS200-family protein [Candidatus Desulfofervidus auxilii]|uniref:Transposase IS200-family protein n=1 Tax=Desulfofervidus auxilii TaxID=1621989 RepID=A0A7U4QK99_DESA2|nr:IS200/IS605 family transposase [Candidatus Desulfofervidus auxilii]AMM40881.1 transposase IS200-family protein [Candidatus Desulfofervidus auxilii]RKY81540.1 MAG: IS200/IS605 family transposase [candidate division KSB1 bacterium]CAD7775099.1 Transposase IS200 like protein [Candidatus Methanoperedenaceae archaeon GB50]CAD7776572.1 Transposase IS200 like protein [Candidatus Methanoperedenaceae archaeon GB37]
MSQGYKHKYTSVYLINYHFIWIPRRRRPVLKGAVKRRLRELIEVEARKLGLEILALEIQPDHVHLFVNSPPDMAPNQIMFRIKGYTARVLREEFPWLKRLPSMWTRSYFVSTAGSVSSDTIRKYIERQSTTA